MRLIIALVELPH